MKLFHDIKWIIISITCILAQIACEDANNTEDWATRKCFAKAECIFGDFMNHTVAEGQTDCREQCQNTHNCKWFTFNPSKGWCLKYSTCTEFHSTSQCPDCVSGKSDCDVKCWIQDGKCHGKFVDKVATRSADECSKLCYGHKRCNYFTFDSIFSGCILLEDCSRVETCKSCISSHFLCQRKNTSAAKNNNFTKLLVATGLLLSGTKSVEIIDLSSPKMKCQNLPNFPVAIAGAVGALGLNNEPLICGGFKASNMAYQNACTKFENGAWQSAPNLNQKRAMAGISRSPFPDSTLKILVTAGDDGTSEALTESGWKYLHPNLEISTYASCIRHINSTTVVLVDGPEKMTYLFNTENEKWEKVTWLEIFRHNYDCARIRTDEHSLSYSMIVVGGENGKNNILESTEILDLNASRLQWVKGPNLPFGIKEASLAEGPNGEVILVGGYSSEGRYLTTLFKLAHAGATWEEMPQKLANHRSDHVAFLVPDGITNCTLSEN